MLKWIKNLFQVKTYQDDVEYFVSSKNPSNPSEVEFWIRYYDQNIRPRGVV